jgi:glutamate/tyrosine decarboxylase-like PLP-dependent enzyme
MEELSTLCEQHKMWFHVDGNGHAGGYVFSDKLRPPGLHLADSFSLGGSLLPFPQCCNVLVTKWPETYENARLSSNSV